MYERNAYAPETMMDDVAWLYQRSTLDRIESTAIATAKAAGLSVAPDVLAVMKSLLVMNREKIEREHQQRIDMKLLPRSIGDVVSATEALFEVAADLARLDGRSEITVADIMTTCQHRFAAFWPFC